MNYDLCEHGLRIGLDNCDTCSVVGLKSQLRRVLEERNEARRRLPRWRKAAEETPPLGDVVLCLWGDRAGMMTVVNPELVEPHDYWMPLPSPPSTGDER